MPQAAAVPQPKKRIVYNRSQSYRSYTVGEGKAAKKLLAGQSMEVTEAQFAQLTNYKDIVDAERMVPAAARRQELALQENAKLRSQVAEMQADPIIAERLKAMSAARQQESRVAPKAEPKDAKEKPKKGGK